jgi:hypothetical protein
MSVEFLVKLRDAAQMIIDAANEQLEELARILVYNPMPQGVFFWVMFQGPAPHTNTRNRVHYEG